MINLSRAVLFALMCLTYAFSNPSNAQNISLDKKLGREKALEIEKEMGISKHESASKYVKEIGSRLIENLNPRLFEYNFEVVEMKEPNAFALPGGYIYVSRGLLCLVNSEDELAGIIGHEIIHSEFRHSIKQMRSSILPGLIQLPGEIIGVAVNENLGQLINAPITTGNKLFLASYSRKHEKQADKNGMQLMAKTGYDHTQFPLVLENLSRLVEVMTGNKEKFSYFDSHPNTPKRIEYLNKEVLKTQQTTRPNIAASQQQFLNQLDGICYGNNPANGVFQENNYLHPDLNIFMSFPTGWLTDNQSTMVGAMDTLDNQNLMVMGVSSEDKMPEELGSEFVEILRQNNYSTEKAGKYNLNGLPAYLVTLKDDTGENVYQLVSLWFRINNVTFQLLGLGKNDQFEKITKTALSIRMLTPQERSSIQKQTLRIRTAKEGETLEQFNKRTGNIWNKEITTAMNNLQPGKDLKEGQLLKIILNEKYSKE